MATQNHETVRVQVWASVDKGIAEMVQRLNTIPGVRTEASCQGTLGELSEADKADGAQEYPPYVLVVWETDEAAHALETLDGWILTFRGAAWGYLHPAGTHWHTEYED